MSDDDTSINQREVCQGHEDSIRDSRDQFSLYGYNCIYNTQLCNSLWMCPSHTYRHIHGSRYCIVFPLVYSQTLCMHCERFCNCQCNLPGLKSSIDRPRRLRRTKQIKSRKLELRKFSLDPPYELTLGEAVQQVILSTIKNVVVT